LFSHKKHGKNELPESEITLQCRIRLSESNTQVEAAHYAANGTVCELKILPVSTNDVNK